MSQATKLKQSDPRTCPAPVEMDRRIRLLIADDQALMAEGLQRLLQGEYPLVEIVANGREAIDAVANSKPDVVLLDIAMPLLNGIETTHRIMKIAPTMKVVIVTAQSEPEYVVEALRAGASGYVLKRCAFSELLAAIREVLSGHSYVTPLARRDVVDMMMKPELHGSPTTLTPRQREVLQLVAEGYRAKEIANVLHLSVKTAVFHKASIMDKLGLRTTAQLTRYALERGIVSDSSERIVPPLPGALDTETHEEGRASLAQGAGASSA